MSAKIERIPIPAAMLTEWWGYSPQSFYSAAVIYDKFIFLGGEVGINYSTKKIAGDDFRTQAEQTLKNIQATLKDQGTTTDNIVWGLLFVTDIRNAKVFLEVAEKYLPKPPPVNIVIECKNNTNRWVGMTEGGLLEYLVIAAKAGEKIVRTPKYTKVGDFVFPKAVVGKDPQTGKLPTDLKDQAENIFNNLQAALVEAGTDIRNVVFGWQFFRDINDWRAWVDVVNERYPQRPPPMICIMEARNRSNGYVGTMEGALIEYLTIAVTPALGEKVKRYPIPEKMLAEWWGYSPQSFYSAAVDAGPLVILGGEVGINYKTGKIAGDDFKTQAEQIFDNISQTLTSLGTSLENVVWGFCCLKDINDWRAWVDVVNERYPQRPPPMVCIMEFKNKTNRWTGMTEGGLLEYIVFAAKPK